MWITWLNRNQAVIIKFLNKQKWYAGVLERPIEAHYKMNLKEAIKVVSKLLKII